MKPPVEAPTSTATSPCTVDAEPLERARELEPAAPDERQPALDRDRRGRVDGGAGLVDPEPRYLDTPAEHQRASLLAAGG